MKLKGTKFQLKVWRFIKKIPKGSIKTYAQVAKEIGKPLAIRAVAGCYVTTGKIQRNWRARVRRGKQIVFEGDLDSLKRNKDDVKDVSTGFECGIGCDRFANWEEGDQIEAFKLVTQRRKLTN